MTPHSVHFGTNAALYSKLLSLHESTEMHESVTKLLLQGYHYTSRDKSKLPSKKDEHFSTSTSFHSFDEVAGNTAPLDYAFLSPIFDSISKADYKAAFELESLKRVLPSSSCPIIALGGECDIS